MGDARMIPTDDKVTLIDALSARLLGIPATLQVLEFQPDEHPIAGQLLAADPAGAPPAACISIRSPMRQRPRPR